MDKSRINARLKRRHGGLVRSNDDGNPITQSLKDATATRSVFWNNIKSMQSWHKSKAKENVSRKRGRRRRAH